MDILVSVSKAATATAGETKDQVVSLFKKHGIKVKQFSYTQAGRRFTSFRLPKTEQWQLLTIKCPKGSSTFDIGGQPVGYKLGKKDITHIVLSKLPATEKGVLKAIKHLYPET